MSVIPAERLLLALLCSSWVSSIFMRICSHVFLCCYFSSDVNCVSFQFDRLLYEVSSVGHVGGFSFSLSSLGVMWHVNFGEHILFDSCSIIVTRVFLLRRPLCLNNSRSRMVTRRSGFMRCVAFVVEVFIIFTSSLDPTPTLVCYRVYIACICLYLSYVLFSIRGSMLDSYM
jgi:hypothetical protein